MIRSSFIPHVIGRPSSRKLEARFCSSSGIQHLGESRAAYESGVERDYFVQLSGHPDFLRLSWNPIELEYVDSFGKIRTYTPDALVQYRLGSSMPTHVLLEVKLRSKLVAELDDYRDRFYAARSYVSKLDGWKFEVRTERSLRPQFVSNVKFLSRYKNTKLENLVDDYPHQLFHELSARGSATPDYLLTACFSSFSERAKALSYLWAMVAQRLITFDWNSELTMRSQLWIPS